MSTESQTTKPEIHYFDSSLKIAAQRFQADIFKDPQSFIDASDGTIQTQEQIKAAAKIGRFIENEFDKETYFDDDTEAAIKADETITSLLKKRDAIGQMHSNSRKVSDGIAERVDGKRVEIRNKVSTRRIAIFAGRAAVWSAQESHSKSLRSAG